MASALDPLLVPFIRADDESAPAYLDSLMHQHASPLIEAAVLLHAPDIFRVSLGTLTGIGADLRSETIHHLLMRVGAIRTNAAAPIKNYRAYVRVTVRHLCSRYAFKSHRERNFASFGEAVTTLPISDEFGFADIAESITGSCPGHDVAELIEKRSFLKALWSEVCALPPNQRLALLYNLRDKNGVNALPFFLLCHIAEPREIASAMNMDARSLEEIEEMFEQLPLEDSQIAAKYGGSAREIRNARIIARARLQRRMRVWIATT